MGAYTSLAEGIRQFGDDAKSDLEELWRRLIFSLLASNYDDHMRNHAFLMKQPGRWALSPAYDLNPVPEIDRARTPKTSIAEDSVEPSLEEALQQASRFGLSLSSAKKILGEVFLAVDSWRETGRELRLAAAVLNPYASAFEHPMMVEARKITGKK